MVAELGSDLRKPGDDAKEEVGDVSIAALMRDMEARLTKQREEQHDAIMHVLRGGNEDKEHPASFLRFDLGRGRGRNGEDGYYYYYYYYYYYHYHY